MMLGRFEQFSGAIACIHRGISKIERDEMVKAGYKGIFAPCLLILYHHPDGIDAAALGRACDKDKAAVSRIIAEMQKLGLIYRKGENSYRAKLFLTPKGDRAAHYVCRKAVAAVEAAGRGLTEEERIVFYSCLNRIAANIRKIEKTGIPGNIEF